MNNTVLDVLATTPLQEGLLALHRISSGADPYHVQFIFRIDGELDESLLRHCAYLMLKRHPNLKAAFYDADVPHPVQVIPTATNLDWEVINQENSVSEDADFDELAANFARVDFQHPFDLSQPAPLRLRLLRWNKQSRHLVLTAHHIIIDGWSAPLFFAELIELYRLHGHVEFMPQPLAYRRYISWLSERSREESYQVWRTELGTSPTPCLIAPGASQSPGDPPVIFTDQLNPQQTNELQHWCRAHNITLGNAVLFAWAVVLGALVDRDEVFTGTVVSGRPAELSGAESMIGLFINTVPARIQLHPKQDAITQIKNLRDSLLRTRPHEYIGLADIQRHMRSRDLFDTLVVHQNTPQSVANMDNGAGLSVTPLATNDATHYPLTIVPAMVDDTVHIKVEARADLINTVLPQATELIATAMVTLLQAFPASDGVALARLGTGFPVTQLPHIPAVASQSLPELMRGLVAADPDAIAVKDTHTCLTRRQFLSHSLMIAEVFIAAGLKPGDRVALVLKRTVSQPAALLACAWTSITAVQLDAASPVAHNQSIAAQAQVAAVLTDSGFVGDFLLLEVPEIGAGDVEKQIAECYSPAAPLYMVFTSGSTGKPKGVVGTGAGMSSLISAHRQLILGPVAETAQRQLTIGHAWSLAFDASWQPLTALFTGHVLAILDEEEIADPHLYLEALKRHKVDMIETSPTMFGHLEPAGLLESMPGWDGLLVLGLGGEAIDPAVWRKLAQCSALKTYNFYGPTETTVDATVMRLEHNTQPGIGAPLPGLTAELLDRWLRPVPPGIPGELYLHGTQVALGYAGLTDITASHFVADSQGQRKYRTGDYARYDLNTAMLTYLGRADKQVKIRGHRVELGHVLHEILRLPEVADARVEVYSASGTPQIIALVIPRNPSLLKQPVSTASSLMSHLRENAAAHLLPTAIIPVASFPMTSNGKIDLTALPEITSEVYSPPEGEIETQLATVISEITGIKSIDRNTDIRDLGIDSILLLQLITKAVSYAQSDSLLKHLTPRLVLANPTLCGIAGNLADASTTVLTEDCGIGSFAPTPVQQWLIDVGGGRRFCQWAMVNAPHAFSGVEVQTSIGELIHRHALLRARLDMPNNIFTVPETAPDAHTWFTIDRSVTSEQFAVGDFSAFQQAADRAINSIDPAQGHMLQAVWFPQIHQVLLLVHHFAVDGASWRILIGDLNATSAVQSTSFSRWAQLLEHRRHALDTVQLKSEWDSYLQAYEAIPLGTRPVDPAQDRAADAIMQTVTCPATKLLALADTIGRGSQGTVGLREILLGMLSKTLKYWRGATQVLIDLEGHGRDISILEKHGHSRDDISQTAGWFTTITPTLLPQPHNRSISQLAQDAAVLIAAQPSSAVDYSLACGISTSPAEIEVNYLGRLDLGGDAIQTEAQWSLSQNRQIYETLPEMPDPELPRTYGIEITFSVIPGQFGSELSAHFNLAAGIFSTTDLVELCSCWSKAISAIVLEQEQGMEPR